MVKDISEQRNVGIDLFRVVASFMITMAHVLDHGGIITTVESQGLTCTRYIVSLLEIVALCGVNCFALISGYVGYGHKIKYSRIVELSFQVWFYTLPITIVAALLKPEAVSSEVIIKAVFPFALRTYWYFSAFFALFFFEPFLNLLIDSMDNKTFSVFMFSFIGVLSLLPTLFHHDFAGLRDGYSFPWLALLYIIGGGVRKFRPQIPITIRKGYYTFFICIIITCIWRIVAEYISGMMIGEIRFGRLFMHYTSPTIIIASVALLISLSKVDSSHGIRAFSRVFTPTAFGVYLLHEEPLIRDLFIKDKFVFVGEQNGFLSFMTIILITCCVFLAGVLIDWIRIWVFALIRIDTLCRYIGSMIERFMIHVTEDRQKE